MAEHVVSELLLDTFDYVWQRVRARLDGLTADEYFWEPVEDCWSVREQAGCVAGRETLAGADSSPVTTIAWRLWHIGSECLAGYTARGLGDWPLDVDEDEEWYGDVDDALSALDRAWTAFRGGVAALGEDGMWRPLGEGGDPSPATLGRH